MGRNSGIICPTSENIDNEQLSRFISGKSALVAQGGGQRGIFTAGVFDAFLQAKFDPFDEYFGTSAGALNLCPFICRQEGLGKSFIVELTTNPEFFHLFSYIRRKQYMNLDWAFDQIQIDPYRLDIDTGQEVLRSKNRHAFAAATNLSDLEDHYLPMMQDDWRAVLAATCAIPRLYQGVVPLKGYDYVDGGVSAAIPVQEAWRRDARFITVIRTECVEDSLQTQLENDIESRKVAWFKDSLNSIQLQWQSKLQEWKQDWQAFVQQHKGKARAQGFNVMNGGRWMFGADDIYRLSYLLGDKFDSGLADMLMVHYQTYGLTQEFLQSPPDDTFIIQIAPSEPLKSSSLMSRREDLMHDYELGKEAGNRFIAQYEQAVSQWSTRAILDHLDMHNVDLNKLSKS